MRGDLEKENHLMESPSGGHAVCLWNDQAGLLCTHLEPHFRGGIGVCIAPTSLVVRNPMKSGVPEGLNAYVLPPESSPAISHTFGLVLFPFPDGTFITILRPVGCC